MPRRKRNKEKDEKIDESWLLPYSDMLTLLFALFIVLFAMSEIDIKKFEQLAYIFQTEFTGGAGVIDEGVSIIPERDPVDVVEDKEEEEKEGEEEIVEQEVKEYEELRSMQERINEYISSNNLTDTLGTELTEEGLLITIRTDITFDSGSAKVRPQGIEIAEEIATFLNTDPPHEIVVNGHADDRPVHNEEFASNWELSSMRAIQFMYLLLENTEIDQKYFSARGYGEYHPVAPNTDEASRAKNRRVEVLIQPNHDIEDEVENNQD